MRTILSKQSNLLILICVVGFLLRIVQFPFIPSELNRDEAALGYNAYALLQSGKDEWGVSWPVVFRSFGDYKLSGYIYTLIPFIKLFGLTPFAVRLPSLLAGVALIPVAYLFSQTLFHRRGVSLLSAFFIACSPWAIHYSRVAFEANLALVLFILGLSIVMKAERKMLHLMSGTLLLFLSVMTYNAPLLIMPFVVVFLLVWRKISWKFALMLASVFLFAFLLIVPATKGKIGITIFTDAGYVKERTELRTLMRRSLPWRFYTNPVVFYPAAIARSFIQTFSPAFLVQGGGRNPWHQALGTAHILVAIYLLFFTGLGRLCVEVWRQIKKGKRLSSELFLLLLCVISPVAAVITVDAPHATRSLFLFFLICVVAAHGLTWVAKKNRVMLVLFLLIVVIEIGLYMRKYLLVFPTNALPEWNVGMHQAVVKAMAISKGVERVEVVGDPHYDYIYTLFYLKIDPTILQSTRQLYLSDSLGFTPVKEIGNFQYVTTASDSSIEKIHILRENSRVVVKY